MDDGGPRRGHFASSSAAVACKMSGHGAIRGRVSSREVWERLQRRGRRSLHPSSVVVEGTKGKAVPEWCVAEIARDCACSVQPICKPIGEARGVGARCHFGVVASALTVSMRSIHPWRTSALPLPRRRACRGRRACSPKMARMEEARRRLGRSWVGELAPDLCARVALE